MGSLLQFVVICSVLSCIAAAPVTPKLTKEQFPLCTTLDGMRSLAQQLKVEGRPEDVAAASSLYLWGAPLLQMAAALVSTGVKTNAINSLYSIDQLLTPQTQFAYDIVASNSDTLYTVGWLDLTAGPAVLTAAGSNGRFYTLELLDFYTEVFGNPGITQTGDKASRFVVMPCGTDKSKLPAALQKDVTAYYCSNTSIVWVIGRTFVSGEKDLSGARVMQSSLKAFPVNDQGVAKSVVPAAQTAAAKTAQSAAALLKEAGWSINGVSKVEPMFAAILGLAQAWPPTSATSSPLKAAPQFGLDPAKGFNQPALSDAQRKVLLSGYTVGQACINAYSNLTVGGKALKYGWGFADRVGNYGNDFLMRAVAAYVGLGAQWTNVTIYPATDVDKDGAILTGANGNMYTWTIDEKSLPPSKYFSSLIIYNFTNKMIPVVKDAPRWRVNFPANKGEFAKNPDGSVTFWLSYAPPGPPGSPKYQNWLPLSDGRSWAMLRMYGPSPNAVAGGYQPPPIVKVTPADKDTRGAVKRGDKGDDKATRGALKRGDKQPDDKPTTRGAVKRGDKQAEEQGMSG